MIAIHQIKMSTGPIFNLLTKNLLLKLTIILQIKRRKHLLYFPQKDFIMYLLYYLHQKGIKLDFMAEPMIEYYSIRKGMIFEFAIGIHLRSSMKFIL